MKHYSEADLLETYYMQPGESMPVMMHLADCSECAARYERLERKMRQIASCESHERPETFWSRQRISIMRRVGRKTPRTGSIAQATRVAAAAVLVFVLGALVMYRSIEPKPDKPVSVVATAAPQTLTAADEATIPADPWQSDELQDFRSVVQWETWVSETKNGNQS